MKMTEKAQQSWSGKPPTWIIALAKHADQYGTKHTGSKIGFSRTTVSLAIHNKYNRDLSAIRTNTETFLMQCNCPLTDEVITSERCAFNQTREFNKSTCGSCPHKEV